MTSIPASRPYFRSEGFARILAYWMALGLAFQMGLVVWPLGNYSTLVGQFLYLPVLLALFAFPRMHLTLIKSASPTMLLCLGFLMVWLPLSTLWGDDGDIPDLFLEAARVDLLIISFLLAVGYLRRYFPAVLSVALMTSCTLASALALTTLGNELISGTLLTERISEFGFADRVTSLNPVPAGIYFGGITILGTLLARSLAKSPTVIWMLVLSAALCLLVALLTGTRTVMVGLWLALNFFLVRSGRLQRVAVLNMSLLAGLAAGAAVFPDELAQFFLRGGIGSWRPELWLASWQSSLENSLLGAGYQQEIAFTASRVEEGQVSVHTQMHSHNYYLQLLWWSGLPALVGYVVLLTAALRHATFRWSDPLNRVAGTVLVYFCLVQVFDVYNVFTRPSYYWPWIWLPLAVIMSGPASRAPEQRL